MPGPDAEAPSDASSPRSSHLTIAGSGESGAPEDYDTPQDSANEEQGKEPHEAVQDENAGMTPGDSVGSGGEAQRDVMKQLGSLAKGLDALAKGVKASVQNQEQILEKLDNPTGHPAPGQPAPTNQFEHSGNHPSGANPGGSRAGQNQVAKQQAQATGNMQKSAEGEPLQKTCGCCGNCGDCGCASCTKAQAGMAKGQPQPDNVDQFVKNLDEYLTKFEKHIMSEVSQAVDEGIQKAQENLQKSQGLQPMSQTPQPHQAAPQEQQAPHGGQGNAGSDLQKSDAEEVPSFEDLASGDGLTGGGSFGRLS